MRGRVQPGHARDNAGQSKITRFNFWLPLVQKFDSRLQLAESEEDLSDRLDCLDRAMVNSLESIRRTRDALVAQTQNNARKMSAEQVKALDRIESLAVGRSTALLEMEASNTSLADWLESFYAYYALDRLACAASRLEGFRQYLQATGLVYTLEDREREGRQARVSNLKRECTLLFARVTTGNLLGHGALDAVEAKVERFRWTYVESYRIAHERSRIEMQQFSSVLQESRRYIDILQRLEVLARSNPGVTDALDLATEHTQLSNRLVMCDCIDLPSIHIAPCCANCGFVLGDLPPQKEADELLSEVVQAVRRRSAQLSRQVTERIVQLEETTLRLKVLVKTLEGGEVDALADTFAKPVAKSLIFGRRQTPLDLDHGKGDKSQPALPNRQLSTK